VIVHDFGDVKDRPLRRLTHDDYTVACICPMGVELAPVETMLDEMHQSLPTSWDKNSYTLGRMGAHNVVISVMLEIGNNSAAIVATQLLNDFTSTRFGLLVGIGGGIPSDDEYDIRLGDVVVSQQTNSNIPGVVQFDRGKIHSNGQFERYAGSGEFAGSDAAAGDMGCGGSHNMRVAEYIVMWSCH
jgi:nucleoside phosphorylase